MIQPSVKAAPSHFVQNVAPIQGPLKQSFPGNVITDSREPFQSHIASLDPTRCNQFMPIFLNAPGCLTALETIIKIADRQFKAGHAIAVYSPEFIDSIRTIVLDSQPLMPRAQTGTLVHGRGFVPDPS